MNNKTAHHSTVANSTENKTDFQLDNSTDQ